MRLQRMLLGQRDSRDTQQEIEHEQRADHCDPAVVEIQRSDEESPPHDRFEEVIRVSRIAPESDVEDRRQFAGIAFAIQLFVL